MPRASRRRSRSADDRPAARRVGPTPNASRARSRRSSAPGRSTASAPTRSPPSSSCRRCCCSALCVPWVQRRIVRGRWWWVVPYASGAAGARDRARAGVRLARARGRARDGRRDRARTRRRRSRRCATACSRSACSRRRRRARSRSTSRSAHRSRAGRSSATTSSSADASTAIGNEYEGVLVGASVVGCRVPRRARGPSPPVRGRRGRRGVPRAHRHVRAAAARRRCGWCACRGDRRRRHLLRLRGRPLHVAPRARARGCPASRSASPGIALASAFGGSASSHVGRFVSRLARGDLSFASSLVLGKLRANVLPARQLAVALGARSPQRRRSPSSACATAPSCARVTSAAPDLARGIPGLIAGGLAVLPSTTPASSRSPRSRRSRCCSC